MKSPKAQYAYRFLKIDFLNVIPNNIPAWKKKTCWIGLTYLNLNFIDKNNNKKHPIKVNNFVLPFRVKSSSKGKKKYKQNSTPILQPPIKQEDKGFLNPKTINNCPQCRKNAVKKIIKKAYKGTIRIYRRTKNLYQSFLHWKV